MRTALAASMVARSSTCWAGRTVGSQRLDFCSRDSVFISPNMSRQLLVVEPSVPIETVTPFWNISGRGATPPVASFILDTGQVETFVPAWASCLISPTVSHAEWAARQ